MDISHPDYLSPGFVGNVLPSFKKWYVRTAPTRNALFSRLTCSPLRFVQRGSRVTLGRTEVGLTASLSALLWFSCRWGGGIDICVVGRVNIWFMYFYSSRTWHSANNKINSAFTEIALGRPPWSKCVAAQELTNLFRFKKHDPIRDLRWRCAAPAGMIRAERLFRSAPWLAVYGSLDWSLVKL